MTTTKPKRPVPPKVPRIDVRQLWIIAEGGECGGFNYTKQDALQLLCTWAAYGLRMEYYFLKLDKWAAQKGKEGN